MKRTSRLITAIALATSAIAGTAVMADHQKTGDHSKMAPTKNIVETASAVPALSTLVAAVTAAGLVDTLASPGPFTVFAPTNTAFEKLPAGTVGTLVKPENKATLAKILTYHVIAGSFNATAVVKAIKDGGGSVTLKTVSGGNLVASIKEGDAVFCFNFRTDRCREITEVLTQQAFPEYNGDLHHSAANGLQKNVGKCAD